MLPPAISIFRPKANTIHFAIFALMIVGGFLITPRQADAQLAKSEQQPDTELPEPMRFDFGSGPVKPGWIQVTPDSIYAADTGYGIDLGSLPEAVDRAKGDALQRDALTSKTPFYFSVRLPEGNYRVRVVLGDSYSASSNTVKVESRRLMLEHVETRPGEFAIDHFTVNLRSAVLPDGSWVRLKPREKDKFHWDDKLTIEFNGSRPSVCGLEIHPTRKVTTIFLLGDSTVTDQSNEPWNSWGQMVPRFFDTEIAVANFAESGESLLSSLGELRVEKVLSSLRPNDYVFIQFGHNDQKIQGEDALANYKANLAWLVDEIRQRQANPVLVTSMERKGGQKKATLGMYPQTVREVAADKDVALIDLNAMSVQLYRGLGDDLDKAFQDGSHHNSYGSYEIARCVIHGIQEQLPELARHLRSNLPTFNPAEPDPFPAWNIPPSPHIDLTPPEGH
ncbi:rhamnogalacturonan acetylesterase [Blastopirellula marina]|uniref:Rhamnogalacturonan acetylesterase n=1 Tax=Blastopirellula marina TaxID=124 RepID=A0A2S8FFP1_9BACT|nr:MULTISPECIES: rhamnogalacturonan acetylesterase [Pirellulaceae]PQO30744.1 rhamnogalacturonan acetylesterase [Blastopirellula marina]RCS50881.1 rhamnogalacturonan acetylesterase [Bremerella cremea]